VILLDLGALVLDMQAGGDTLGDDAGAKPSRCAVAAGADDAPVKDQADLGGATDVEVVVQDLFEERSDPTADDPASGSG